MGAYLFVPAALVLDLAQLCLALRRSMIDICLLLVEAGAPVADVVPRDSLLQNLRMFSPDPREHSLAAPRFLTRCDPGVDVSLPTRSDSLAAAAELMLMFFVAHGRGVLQWLADVANVSMQVAACLRLAVLLGVGCGRLGLGDRSPGVHRSAAGAALGEGIRSEAALVVATHREASESIVGSRVSLRCSSDQALGLPLSSSKEQASREARW